MEYETHKARLEYMSKAAGREVALSKYEDAYHSWRRLSRDGVEDKATINLARASMENLHLAWRYAIEEEHEARKAADAERADEYLKSIGSTANTLPVEK
jgi:hypothetical protein